MGMFTGSAMAQWKENQAFNLAYQRAYQKHRGDGVDHVNSQFRAMYDVTEANRKPRPEDQV